MTVNTRASPASPSCNAAFRLPRARRGLAAISRAVTKPVKLPSVLPPIAVRQPAKPSTAATAAPPSSSSSGSMRARERFICISARYSLPKAARARAVSCASSRQARTVRACAKLSFRSADSSPMRSCMPPEALRMRRPMRWIGTAASGYSAAAIRLSSQSSQSIEATSPTSVTASARPLTVRVIASRMVAASVVKRAARVAGASRSTRARSACVRCANMRPCSSRITSSTTCWTSTVWKYCAIALTAVTLTTIAGIWYRMRSSLRSNSSIAWSIRIG